MAKGYSSASKVAAYLGATLTSAQQTFVTDQLLPAAEAWLDRQTGRNWMASAITDEHIVLTGRTVFSVPSDILLVDSGAGEDVYLANPYASITSVNDLPAAAGNTLAYTEIDPTTGWLRVSDSWYGRDMYVTYVPSLALPDDLGLAATMMLAYWLDTARYPDLRAIRSYSVSGADLRVDATPRVAVPPEVEAIVARYRPMVWA